jgi:hypothetical protein
MKRLVVLLAIVLLAGCAYKQQPIYNATDPMPPAAQSLPLARIEALVIAGAQMRAWRVERMAPGSLRATQVADKFSATVDITFDQREFRITYRDSSGLMANNGAIHSHYNFWVRNLEADIRNKLSTGQ